MTDGFNSADYIDLRGLPCPLNFIRCRLAIEKLGPDNYLKVDLDRGEPENMVIPGLQEAGHHVEIIYKETNWLTLMVDCEPR